MNPMTRHERTRRPGAVGALAVLAVAAAWGLPGCDTVSKEATIIEVGGYTNRPLFRDDIRTVAIPIFTKPRTLFRRDLEFRLTEALIKKVETRTPYKVTPRGRADTVIEGTVVGFSERVLTESPTNEPREVQVTVTVKIVWRDLRSGAVLRRAERLSDNATFVVDAGETEARATAESFDDLVERIVELMETDF